MLFKFGYSTLPPRTYKQFVSPGDQWLPSRALPSHGRATHRKTWCYKMERVPSKSIRHLRITTIRSTTIKIAKNMLNYLKPFLLYKHPRLKSSHPFPYGQACPMLDIRPCGKRRSWDTRAAQAGWVEGHWLNLVIRIGNGKFLAGGSQFATLQGLGKGEDRLGVSMAISLEIVLLAMNLFFVDKVDVNPTKWWSAGHKCTG